MRFVLGLLALLTMTSSNAALWEMSFTGIAFLPSGQSGIEVVRYAWDPAHIQSCVAASIPSTCPDVPGFPPGSIFKELSGPVSVSYFGLVNGFGTGVLRAFTDCCEEYLHIGGTHTASYGETFPYDNPFEYTEVVDQWVLANGGFFGGEDGWVWRGGTQVIDRFMIVSVRRVAVSEPGAIVLLCWGFLIGAVNLIASRQGPG